MSVLIFVDLADGQIKKSSHELLSYGSKIAVDAGVEAAALVLGTTHEDLSSLGKFGVQKVYTVASEALNTVDSQVYSAVIADAVKKVGATVVVFSHNQTGKAVAARVSAKLKAGLVSGACAIPDTANGQFVVKKTVFSGKAYCNINITTAIKLIALNPNSFQVVEAGGTAVVESLDIAVGKAATKVVSVNKLSGDIPLTEADIVVSGGRGLKGPENWGIIEDLAKVLHAATACSRPVADAHWRPHHEHVGQTGYQVAPNLYIAVGISGAIQHLAGVNRSKVIVVINKDPEAPFFKAADYGIVGDAFDVVPKLTAAIKQLNA